MGVQSDDVSRIVRASVPVLCFDTCSILDIMRDPTRDAAAASDLAVAVDLLDHIEVRKEVVALVCDQVRIEFSEHVDHVERECGDGLKKFGEKARRIDDIAMLFGGNGTIPTAHLLGHAARARTVSERMLRACETATQSAQIRDRAFDRVYCASAPARKGKDSLKDCIVIETYLEAVAKLRAGGLATRVVFLSSNTADYLDQSRNLHPNLRGEFDTLGMEYAPNFGAARHFLGL